MWWRLMNVLTGFRNKIKTKLHDLFTGLSNSAEMFILVFAVYQDFFT